MALISRWAIIALILVVIIVAVVVFVARRRNPEGAGRPLVLLTGRLIGAAYACFTIVATAVGVISTLTADQVDVAIPVREYWPGAFPWVTVEQGPTAEVVGGGFVTADVAITGLGMDARAFLAAGHAIQGATFIVIAITIALLCQRLLTGTAFTPALTRAVTVTGMSVAIGGMLWQVAFGIGSSIASAQALTVTGWMSEHPLGNDPLETEFDPYATGLPEPTVFAQIDLWPLLLGLALAAVGLAFRRAERLQRDAQGLV
jgi:energy-coupling factor transporter transmembrane protein EcfT